MYPFKTLENNECFYTDTDSVVLQHEIDPKYISENIGDFKLEYKINHGAAPGSFDSKFIIKQKQDLKIKFDTAPAGSNNSITSKSINYYVKNKKYKQTFIDSLRIQPSSLDKISKELCLEINKMNFPHNFKNSKSKMYYIGGKPNIRYWGGINQTEYDKIAYFLMV